MNKPLISRLMHERVAGLRRSGVYCFRGDFEFILRGVVLEYVPRGVYIWNFRFPLFDFFGPNLNYSDRLPGSAFIGKGEMAESDIVNHVLNSPEGRDAFEADASPNVAEFVQYLHGSNGLLNPNAQLVYAAALILLGEDKHAADMLDELRQKLHPSSVRYRERLQESLRGGTNAARDFLAQVRKENLLAFGLA